MKRWIGLGLAALVLVAPAPASAAPGKLHATTSDQGDYYATASVSTKVRKPRRIWLVGSIDRPAPYVVDWSLSCTRRLNFESRDGTFSSTTERTVRLPRLIRKAKSCDLYASIEWENTDPDFEPMPTRVQLDVRATQR